jgi:hypothetical protein
MRNYEACDKLQKYEQKLRKFPSLQCDSFFFIFVVSNHQCKKVIAKEQNVMQKNKICFFFLRR